MGEGKGTAHPLKQVAEKIRQRRRKGKLAQGRAAEEQDPSNEAVGGGGPPEKRECGA